MPGPMMPITIGAVPPRGTGLALMERVGIIEIDLPDGVRVRVDSGVNEKAFLEASPALGRRRYSHIFAVVRAAHA